MLRTLHATSIPNPLVMYWLESSEVDGDIGCLLVELREADGCKIIRFVDDTSL